MIPASLTIPILSKLASKEGLPAAQVTQDILKYAKDQGFTTGQGKLSNTIDSRQFWKKLIDSQSSSLGSKSPSTSSPVSVIKPSPPQSPPQSPVVQQMNVVPAPPVDKSSVQTQLFAPGRKTTVKFNNLAIPTIFGGQGAQKVLQMSRSQLLATIAQDGFKGSKQVPSYFASTSMRDKNKNQMMEYIEQVNATVKNKQAQNMKALSAAKLAQWNQNQKVWLITDRKLANKLQASSTQKLIGNLQVANSMASLQLTQEETQKYIPAVVKQVLQWNSQYSKFGIGPIKSQGLPFYVGRYIDKATGRIRILPKASNKYLNPFSYSSKLSYLQARILNKWNQFVQCQQQYTNFKKKNPTQWHQSQVKKIQDSFQNRSNFESSILNWYRSQYSAFVAFLPCNQSTRIVLGRMTEDQLKQWAKKIDITKQTRQTAATMVKNCIEFLTPLQKKTLQGLKTTTIEQQKQALKIAQAYANYTQKNLKKNQNMIKKLAKSFIPENINQKTIQKVLQQQNIFKSEVSGKYFNPDKDVVKLYASKMGTIKDQNQYGTTMTAFKQAILKNATQTIAKKYKINKPIKKPQTLKTYKLQRQKN